jgi:hypothetical protein
MQATRASLIAARYGEQHREFRRNAAVGRPFLWFLSFGRTKERNLLSGNPRQLNNPIVGLRFANPNYRAEFL